MKRYLIIGNAESPHLVKWAKELVNYYQVYVVSSQGVSPEIRQIIPDDRIYAFNLTISEAGGNVKVLRTLFPLVKIIRKVRPDLINAHYITSHGFVAALAGRFVKKSYKLILSAWGTDILVTPQKNIIYKQITRYALKKADLATSDSGRVTAIMNQLAPVEVMQFPFGLESLPDIVPGDKNPNLFFSNRTLNANSNIDRVLHLFAELLKENDEYQMVIANDGPKKDELIEISKRLGLENNVKFVGYISQDKQTDYYRKARYFFSILSSDALSVSLLEAMANGCIPILSDLPDNKDWVENNVNGFIINAATRSIDVSTLSASADAIFSMNRKMISDGAIFPESIREYNNKLSEI